jgi:adenylate kinase
MPAVIQEYKDSRGLWPIKIMVHGPPASRITYFCKKLAEHYQIHLINSDEVMHEVIKRLERRTSPEQNEDIDPEDIEADRETLNDLRESLKSNGKYSPIQIISSVKEKLRSMPCKNQGYILDGFPNLMDEATELFKRLIN